MAFHPDITRKDDVTVALDAANAAVRIASRQLTGNAGTVEIPNADGTSTIMGAGAGDTGVAPWVGDVTAPGKPLGITAESHNGAVWVSWNGTLDGGVPADFDHVRFMAVDGSKTVDMGRLTAAGKVTAAELTAGHTVTITAVAYDDAHAADGSSAPNASVVSDPVTVVVQSAADASAVQKAQDDAQSALDKAGQAKSTANGKNKIFSSASEPAHTGLVPGDLWFQLDASSHVTGIQVWNGSVFVDYVLMANQILVAGSVGTVQLANGAVTADHITASEALLKKLLVRNISADEIDVGSLAAAIVTSGLFQTATSGSRVVVDSNGIRAIDNSGVTTVNIPSDGSTPMFTGGFQTGSEGSRIKVSEEGDGVGSLQLLENTSEVGSLRILKNENGYVYVQLGAGVDGIQIASQIGEPDPLQPSVQISSTYSTSIAAGGGANINGTWFANELSLLPTSPRQVGGVGTIGFAGGIRYVYDGKGSWQEYDTRVVSTNLTDFFTPASGFTQYNNESQVYYSGGLWHLHIAVKGSIPSNTYTIIGTVKPEYRPLKAQRGIACMTSGWTGGAWMDPIGANNGDVQAGRVHVGNKSGSNGISWATLDFVFPATQLPQGGGIAHNASEISGGSVLDTTMVTLFDDVNASTGNNPVILSDTASNYERMTIYYVSGGARVMHSVEITDPNDTVVALNNSEPTTANLWMKGRQVHILGNTITTQKSGSSNLEGEVNQASSSISLKDSIAIIKVIGWTK